MNIVGQRSCARNIRVTPRSSGFRTVRDVDETKIATDLTEASVPDDLEALRRELLDAAFLFDDPRAYRAGVEDTVRAISMRVIAQRERPAS